MSGNLVSSVYETPSYDVFYGKTDAVPYTPNNEVQEKPLMEKTVVYDSYGNKLPEKRVGNAERDRYVDHLANCVSTGHLKPEEFEERRDKALEAVTNYELAALTQDLPEVPKPKTVAVPTRKVWYQVSGNGVPFSPWRWGAAMFLSLCTAILPTTIMAYLFHGLDHAPAAGGLPVMLMIFGIISTLITGVCFAPDSKEDVPVR